MEKKSSDGVSKKRSTKKDAKNRKNEKMSAGGQTTTKDCQEGQISATTAASNPQPTANGAPETSRQGGGRRPRVIFPPRRPFGNVAGGGGGGLRNHNNGGGFSCGDRPPQRQDAAPVDASQSEDGTGGGRRPAGATKNARRSNKNHGNGAPNNQFSNNRRPPAGQQRFPATAKNRRDHAGMAMAGPTADCLICCQRSDLFAVGDCLHSMCMECGIRTRILGKSPLCPHCRTDVGTLYFVEWRQNSELAVPLSSVVCEESAKFAVQFESAYALDAFRSYLAHKCRLCCARKNSPDAFAFPNFAALQQHMTQCHQLTFCYLCSENLNTLTRDRRTYNRDQLQRHMNGEERIRDDGFRGHPKCLFCEQRFYDDEQQYRHLRKDHFFCQICDSDGADNFFYRTHNELTRHYKRAHHPCTHADCVPLGIVFQSDVELNVHQAKQHTVGGGRKHCAIDFNYTSGNGGETSGVASSSTAAAGSGGPPAPAPIFAIVPSAQAGQQPARIVPSASFNAMAAARNVADFPLLDQFQQLQPPYGAPPNWRHMEQMKAINNARSAPRLPLQSGEQFPGLPGASSSVAGGARSAGQNAAAPAAVWAKAATRQLFKLPSAAQNTTATGAGAGSSGASKPPAESRRKVVPLPDAFPEGMREVMRARQAGLPDPPPAPLELSHADRFVEVKRQEKAQKKKDKKAKRVPAAIAAQMAAASAHHSAPVASSRFCTLQADSSDDEEDRDELGRPKNWWTTSARPPPAPILHESNDDFVRIDVGTTVTHRRAAAPVDPSPASRVAISLSSIAANLCPGPDDSENAKDRDGDERTSSESTEHSREKKSASPYEDELELIRHQRQARYNNDYNLNNEDLDLQMALEMSLLSSQLFLPPKAAASSAAAKNGIETSAASPPPGFVAQLQHSAGSPTAETDLSNPPGFSPKDNRKAVKKGSKTEKEKNDEKAEEGSGGSVASEPSAAWTAGGLLSGLLGALKK